MRGGVDRQRHVARPCRPNSNLLGTRCPAPMRTPRVVSRAIRRVSACICLNTDVQFPNGHAYLAGGRVLEVHVLVDVGLEQYPPRASNP